MRRSIAAIVGFMVTAWAGPGSAAGYAAQPKLDRLATDPVAPRLDEKVVRVVISMIRNYDAAPAGHRVEWAETLDRVGGGGMAAASVSMIDAVIGPKTGAATGVRTLRVHLAHLL